MQKLSNTNLITLVSKLLVLLLIAKVISLGIWWYLPSEGVELNAKKSYLSKYQRVSFSNMLKVQKKSAVQSQQREEIKAYNINNLVLKGLYGSRFEGFAIIAKKATPKKTEIVAVGESYEGYKLKEIELSGVLFTKSAKEYKLLLEESKTKFTGSITRVENEVEEISQKEVSRQDIQTYSSNPALIWKDIGIREKKNGNDIIGFEVTRVKPHSKMATLGLKKSDLIIKANNIPLTSINSVLKLYKDIDKINTLALTIQRNNEEKEIIYEIR